ncbi:MAG: type III-B CRISPR module-associated protein Cmr5 [Candidatus Vecturithrix sp.]|jgi:CRISPR-associated protein Cmr5|nr:type III-B CRISPR module-associated protein Cmr5 [Candidatus Vecturithrix sp.]
MSEKTTTSTGIEQGRATKAYDFVKDVKTKYPDKWDNYKSGVKKLPALIKTNGLGQALAFINNRDNFPKVYEQLEEWLQREEFRHLLPAGGNLVQEVIKLDSPRYRQVTMETLAILNWMRRFVDGLDQ